MNTERKNYQEKKPQDNKIQMNEENEWKIEDSISFKLNLKNMKKRTQVRVYRGYKSVIIPSSEFNSNVVNSKGCEIEERD